MSITNVASNCVSYLTDHKGGSLAFGGCASFIGATACGIAVTPTTVRLVKEHKKKKKKTRKDMVKLCAEVTALYLPAIGMTVGGCCLINKSCKTYEARIASATAATAAAMEAYRFTKKELDDYREQVKEEIGKNKEQKIHDKVVEKGVENEEPCKYGPAPDDGKIWCKFYQTGVWFRASVDDVHKVEKRLSDRFGFMCSEAWISYNDVYRELDIEETPTGDYFGWDCEYGINWTYSWGQFENGDKYMIVDWDYMIDPKIESITGGYSPMADE